MTRIAILSTRPETVSGLYTACPKTVMHTLSAAHNSTDKQWNTQDFPTEAPPM
jgi:hypothetical protein